MIRLAFSSNLSLQLPRVCLPKSAEIMEAMHHPEYRAKFAENLKRELPPIPLAKDFWGFSKAGKELAWLHIEYESLELYPLKFMETILPRLGQRT